MRLLCRVVVVSVSSHVHVCNLPADDLLRVGDCNGDADATSHAVVPIVDAAADGKQFEPERELEREREELGDGIKSDIERR